MIRAQTRVSVLTTLLSLAIGFLLPAVRSQSTPCPLKADDLLQEKLRLLSDLQGLAARARQLEKPLARGKAEAEIGSSSDHYETASAEFAVGGN